MTGRGRFGARLAAAGLARCRRGVPRRRRGGGGAGDAAGARLRPGGDGRGAGPLRRHPLAARALHADGRATSPSGARRGPSRVPARGKVEFAKPGRMRFEYESPEPSLVVSDGKTLWIYDPTAKEVQVLAVSEGFLSAAAIQFLLGEGKLERVLRGDRAELRPERAELELRPRAEADLRAHRPRRSSAETGWIRETTVHDLLGNRTADRLRGHRGGRRAGRGALPLRAARGGAGADPRGRAAMTSVRTTRAGFPDSASRFLPGPGCRKVRRGDESRGADDGPPSPPSGSRRLTRRIAPRGGTVRAARPAKGARGHGDSGRAPAHGRAAAPRSARARAPAARAERAARRR